VGHHSYGDQLGQGFAVVASWECEYSWRLNPPQGGVLSILGRPRRGPAPCLVTHHEQQPTGRHILVSTARTVGMGYPGYSTLLFRSDILPAAVFPGTGTDCAALFALSDFPPF